MSEVTRLKEYSEKAKQICVEIDSLWDSELVAGDSRLREILNTVRHAAKLVADNAMAPVKIGILGEFSSGKTLLIGSLIGYADALPVSELPTTGNVTAINLAVEQELQTTQVGPYRIHFLDHAGYRECLAFMLEEARKRARVAGIRSDLLEQLKSITADSQNVLSQIESWSREVWRITNNPALRFLLRELLLFVRAYAMCGPGLCESDQPFAVSADVARRGLALPIPKEDIQSQEFSALPFPSAKIPTRPSVLTEQQLRDAFPLIRLVSVDVTISRHIWDLTGLTGIDRFCLMDFPGLGSEASGVRDLFLCLRELEQIHTILILLNGRRPGGSEGSRLYNLLQEHRPGQDIRDMILVSVGRFDELPLSNEGQMDTLISLAQETQLEPLHERRDSIFTSAEDDPVGSRFHTHAGTVTATTLLQKIPVLATCVIGARAIAAPERDDRITLVSPMFHLRFLENKNPSISVGSEEFIKSNLQVAEKASEMAALWGKVVARLESSHKPGTNEPLIRWLKDFATDGGIGRLRQVIVSHLQSHGILQRHKDILLHMEQLRKSLRTLEASLPSVDAPITIVNIDRARAIEHELQSLIRFYESVRSSLATHPPFTVLRDGFAVSVNEHLKQQVLAGICEWPVWDALWHNVRDGFISNPGKRESVLNGIFGPLDNTDDEEDNSLPTRSDDFYAPFEKTLQDLTEYACTLVDQAVTEWLQQLHEKVAPWRVLLLPHVERPTLIAEIKHLKIKGTAGLVTAMRAALDPPILKPLLFPPNGNLAEAKLEFTRPDPAHVFPLARSDKYKSGRVFAWDQTYTQASSDARPPKHHGHQAMILRIRDHLADAIHMELSQVLSSLVEHVISRFHEAFLEMCNKLKYATIPAVLQVLVKQAPTLDQAPAPSGDRSETLSRLQWLIRSGI